MQNLPVLLAVFVTAAAIIAVLFWRVKPQVAPNTDVLDKRIAEEVKRTEMLQARLDANEATQREAIEVVATAKANMEAAQVRANSAESRTAQIKAEVDKLQEKYNNAEPLIATAKAQLKSAEDAWIELTHRYSDLIAKHETLQIDYNAATERVSSTRTDAEHMRTQIDAMAHTLEILQLELTEERAARVAAVTKLQSDEASASQFKVISQEILDKTLAEAKLGMGELAATLQKASNLELDKHAGKVAQTLEPLQAKLLAYDAAVESLKKGTQENYGSLREQINELQKTERSLHDQAKALTSALSGSSKVKANYGEMILKQLVEFVGMQEKCHFETQASRETEEGRKIPDLVVSLPGGQKVLVDAKAVMEACVEAQMAEIDAQRAMLLKKHCDNVRSRVADLSSKNYFVDHQDAVEAVVLFLPAENLYATAMENDPGLTEYAMSKSIILCGPNSLMLLLKVSNQLWRRAAVEKEIKDIRDCGERIYKAACDFVEKFAGIGKRIQALETEYNSAVGTFEGRLLPAGRRMSSFESISGNKELAEIEPVKDNVREFKEATRQLVSRTPKLPDLIMGDETAELSFSAGEA